MTTHTSPRRSTPQVLQRPTVSYVRIPPAAPGQEQPIAISKEEFRAVLAHDTGTRDRYEHRLGGLVVNTVDTLRLFHRKTPPAHAPVSPTVTAAITTVEAEIVALRRVLDDVAAGLDHPSTLHAALASLALIDAQLRTVCPLDSPSRTPGSAHISTM